MACEGCFDKQIKIDKLEKRIVHLEYKLRRQELKSRAGYFGSSTPSSKIPIKENSKRSSDKGGAKNGHEGHGRKSISGDEADRIEHLAVDDKRCPDCGEELKNKGIVERTVVEKVPVRVEKVLYECEKKWCPKCKKTIQKKPVVLPKSLYGNQLIASAATMHYVHGIPVRRIESMLGNKINTGSLYDTLHRVAGMWKPAIEKLIKDYRVSLVKHADETGWRNDGQSGYSWLFCDKDTSIFRFEDNRSGRVPAENNRAERELRPTVIARKVSFGSQSKKGAETRSILMTILHTAQKRLKNQTIEDWFKNALDKFVIYPNIEPTLY